MASAADDENDSKKANKDAVDHDDDEAMLRSGYAELKERKLLIKIPRRHDKYMNILAINKHAYIHPSQLILLTGINELVFDDLLKRVSAESTQKNEYFMRVEAEWGDYTLNIFEWVKTRLGVECHGNVTMLRFDKIDAFLNYLLKSEVAKRYKEFIEQAKVVRP